MNESQIRDMVERFLRWKLPYDFNPDGGISYNKNQARVTPIGTNLLTATQADRMIREITQGIENPNKVFYVIERADGLWWDGDGVKSDARFDSNIKNAMKFYDRSSAEAVRIYIVDDRGWLRVTEHAYMESK